MEDCFGEVRVSGRRKNTEDNTDLVYTKKKGGEERGSVSLCIFCCCFPCAQSFPCVFFYLLLFVRFFCPERNDQFLDKYTV